MNIKKIILGILIIVVVYGLYYAISPLFINIQADEAIPVSKQMPESISLKEENKKENIPAKIIGTTGHPASGTARIVKIDDKTYLRYENFKTINGPDIYVYLSKDINAKEFVSLGKVRATEGNINYEIPSNINVSDYPYALVWCEDFGVLFNSAKLN